jgi:hypothetical protein
MAEALTLSEERMSMKARKPAPRSTPKSRKPRFDEARIVSDMEWMVADITERGHFSPAITKTLLDHLHAARGKGEAALVAAAELVMYYDELSEGLFQATRPAKPSA